MLILESSARKLEEGEGPGLLPGNGRKHVVRCAGAAAVGRLEHA